MPPNLYHPCPANIALLDDGSQKGENSPHHRSIASKHRALCANHNWRGISWRFACATFFSVILALVLRIFETSGQLDTWGRRWFNLLTILFSSIVSLSLGSLIGLLGGMLRWPLLARKGYSARDVSSLAFRSRWSSESGTDTGPQVDLILGMANPTGSVRLVWDHIKRREWTFATSAALLYVFVNMVSRLSIAAFGLTYDLNEAARVEYPVKVTDWSTDGWFSTRKDQLGGGNEFQAYASSFCTYRGKHDCKTSFLANG